MFEFHISKRVRELYQFDDMLFSTSGNVVFAHVHSVRLFADKINLVREASRYPERAVRAGDINAMGLIDEVLHYVVELYRQDIDSQVMEKAFAHVNELVGEKKLKQSLKVFVEEFPPLAVHRGETSAAAYLKAQTAGIPNTYIVLEEMLLLWLANTNPAFKPFKEFFEDAGLIAKTAYLDIVKGMDAFFEKQPVFGPYHNPLVTMLREPVVASPDSLDGQLEYIRTHWAKILAGLLIRILGGMDLLKEERKQFFFVKGSSAVLSFSPFALEELERFSPDVDWMPKVVLIAKSTYVWLDQLSRKYSRSITRIDQIPDEELEILARWGFTGLWLIGVWERSNASRKIKRMSGNPEAESSAYSIYEYTIATELGGEEALNSLRERAWRYGIRLATDMVPNHMGIFSRWVVEHPDWFIQLPYPPFPSYSFTGENLSEDDRVELYIEDGYWSRRDAAVVFKRVDRHTGDVRYIYHGNDGTHMPWNDTAQLDHLKHEVRQAVIDLTLDVARRFPIIRFDAAMTLAKKHFQRLWYPVPGFGGDIPSRAGQGITTEEFNRLFPVEFWRELVDRVAAEAPNTLLLAEAFWLMEGYFVRSLGMHRVYNSAFMNMLKAEENSKYRDVMKNVLKFNPEILRRFVNFMNNPDEEPAVEQFGKDDKYFGVATMMVTMPGLPMFGHGQVEGFGEKYGMEYRRSYWDESVDWDLVHRHEREIFPLMRKRHLFSGVEQFVLYDFHTPDGWVNEDVYAYSNRCEDERALVVYNNRYAEVKGWVRRSVGISKDTSGRRRIVHKTLGEGLGLSGDEKVYYIFDEHKTGLQYIRHGRELCTNGLYVYIGAFKANVFLNFREVHDDDAGNFARLAHYLGGNGVSDMSRAFMELYLENILRPMREIISLSVLQELLEATRPERPLVLKGIKDKLLTLLNEARSILRGKGDTELAGERIITYVRALAELGSLKAMAGPEALPDVIAKATQNDARVCGVFYMWSILHQLGAVYRGDEDFAPISRNLIDEWYLTTIIGDNLKETGLDDGAAAHLIVLIKLLVNHYDFLDDLENDTYAARITKMLADQDVRQYLGVNFFNEKWWFNRESLEDLMTWLAGLCVFSAFALSPDNTSRLTDVASLTHAMHQKIMRACDASEYQIERFMNLLGEEVHAE